MSILINSDGTWKDVTDGGGGTGIESGNASCSRTITTTNYCKWVKSGHIVMVEVRADLKAQSGIGGSSTVSESFSGLPKPYCAMVLKTDSICTKYDDNRIGSYSLSVDGILSITTGGVYSTLLFRDWFTYISSE